jgi:Caspase domain
MNHRTGIWKFVVVFLLSVPSNGLAQEKRALIIGIDQYTPAGGYPESSPYWVSGIHDLLGCKNDALTIRSLLLSRFGFSDHHIDSLFDGKATHAAILAAIRLLLDKSAPGDIAVLYYAGHGTRVKNSLSFEPDHLDECIVPADTWKDTVTVIRDKELSKLFSEFIDKRVKLTVIFDCCNSGSLSRGMDNLDRGSIRYAPEPGYDVKDSYKPDTFPEDRGGNYFLIFSAAQSDQPAQEIKDEAQLSHGAFTYALNQAFLQQSVDASVSTIFASVRAILKSEGLAQEPVVNGPGARLEQTLLGIGSGTIVDRSLVAVEKVNGRQVTLQGGYALGLYKENRLMKLGKGGKDTLVTVVIDSVAGIVRSIGHVIQGPADSLAPGDQLIVGNWASSGRPLLKLYVPADGFSEAYVDHITGIARQLKASGKTRWVDDIRTADPYTRVFFRGQKCFVKVDTAAPEILADVTAEKIFRYCRKDSAFFMELPVSLDSARAFAKKLASNKWIQIVHDPAEANYSLFGRLGRHQLPAYGWRRTQLAARDSLESLPLVTTCYELAPGKQKSVGDSLLEVAMKLSKLYGWLTLKVPDNNRQKFAYGVEIVDADSQQPILNNQYRIGENVYARLVLDPNPHTVRIPRFVYVFGIDQDGDMQLLYPAPGEVNEENKFPKYDLHDNMIQQTNFQLCDPYVVPPPSGTDNFFLLTTDEPIPNAGTLLNQTGVYSGIETRGLTSADNPLDDLFDMGNSGSRGFPTVLPSSWSLQRISMLCKY